MAFLSIRSENPQFSWVTYKNPNSNAGRFQAKEHKEGVMLGYFSDLESGCENCAYNIVFEDPPLQSTYGEEYSRVEPMQHESPLFVVDAIKEFLPQLLKPGSVDKDTEALQEVEVGQMYMHNETYAEVFHDEIPEVNVGYYDKQLHVYGKTTTGRVVKTTALLALLAALDHYGTETQRHSSRAEKYAEILKELDPGYYVRALFRNKILRSTANYEDHVETIETDEIDLVRRDLHSERIEWAKSQLDFSKPIVDLGCGEGRYVHLAHRAPLYIGIDPDEEVRAQAEEKAEKKDYDGETRFSDRLENTCVPEDAQILCSEVIEHMEPKKAESLIADALREKPDRVLLTTPNIAFNQHYPMEDELRHDDHVTEHDEESFRQLIDNSLRTIGITENEFFNVEFEGIGDMVNGVQPTQAAILENETSETANQYRRVNP